MTRAIAISKDEAHKLIQEVKGQIINHAWRGAGSAIFLELGELKNEPPKNNASGEHSISIEWSWRIEDKHKILIGSWSDDELINTFKQHVLNQSIVNISIFGRLPEIDIELSNGNWLTSFATAEGQPAWTFKINNKGWLYYKNGAYHLESSDA